MTAARVSASGRRISTLQSDLRAAGLDAFVVTHLPNVRYLTGLNATAGAVILGKDACTLVVDFRYETAATAILEATPDHPFNISIVENTYDETLSALLVSRPVARIGIEGASMTVGRFNRLVETLKRARRVRLPPRCWSRRSASSSGVEP